MFIATLLNAGTTATVALLRDGIELVVASVGDSRALLCRKGKAVKLTIDHTPERKDEKERYILVVLITLWGSPGQTLFTLSCSSGRVNGTSMNGVCHQRLVGHDCAGGGEQGALADAAGTVSRGWVGGWR